MQGTTVEELLRQARRFEEETGNLKQFLDELTTDGAGLLYDLKMAVGAETDLGHAISSIGGVVRQAATSAINALTETHTIIDQKATETSQTQAQTSADFTNLTTQIGTITFE